MTAAPRRLAYLGTPAMAVPPLEALVAAGHEVVAVVTRPDRRRGRGGATSPSPVKAAADALGIPVVHDHRELLRPALARSVDLGVVVAYGRIVPAEVLAAIPMVNLHFSLLPRWRGAAPVERALLAGDRETGVCLMQLDEGLDTGPVYAAEVTPIEAGDDLSSLRERLVGIGCRLLLDGLAGPLPEPRSQEGKATYADKLDSAELELRWERPAEALARVVRLDRAWTTFRGRRLHVLRAAAVAPPTASVSAPAPGDSGPAGTLAGEVATALTADDGGLPGTWGDDAVAASGPVPEGGARSGRPGGDDGVVPGGDALPGTLAGDVVATGEGGLRLVTVQPEGKRPMPAADWLRGIRPSPGERLGQ